jgi:hypothetical protein
MKFIISTLIVLLSFNAFSQDTIKISQFEIDGVISAMDTLMEQDSINNILIEQQTIQINNFKTLTKQDSILLIYKNQEIDLLNGQIKLYNDKLKVVDKWYNKRWVGFIMGVAATATMIHVIDYSLPQQ